MASKTETFYVNNIRLRHNNQYYAPGSEIQMDKTLAKPLLAKGYIIDKATYEHGIAVKRASDPIVVQNMMNQVESLKDENIRLKQENKKLQSVVEVLEKQNKPSDTNIRG